MPLTDELLTAKEAAAEIGCTLASLYGWRHRNVGPISFRRGRHLVYRRSDINAYLTRERELTTRGAAL